MKTILILMIGISLTCTSYSQSEGHLAINSTITSFRGNIDSYIFPATRSDAESISNKGYYGRQKGVGWSIEASTQHVYSKSGILLGIGGGYERLNSRLQLVREAAATGLFTSQTAHSVFGFFNIYPYVGKRFYLGKHKIDADFGPELGLPLSAVLKVKGEATYKTKHGGDFRLRLQMKWQYKRYGIQAGYSLGILDYHDFINFGVYTAYSNIGRLGVFYQFKQNKKAVH